MIRVAVDTGGTFTDCVVDTGSGPLHLLKVLSTPGAPEAAILEALARLGLLHNGRPGFDALLHATTVATNAILERKGARACLITTEGFRDVLAFGRQKRADTNRMTLPRPAPLIARRDVFEVTERMGADGGVVTPLDGASLARAVEKVAAHGYEAVAVAFLHAHLNPAHEAAVVAALAAAVPGVSVSASHLVSPRMREYERFSTTAADAYVKPGVTRYLSRLVAAVGGDAAPPLHVMQSNGGLASPALVAEAPIRIVESGPAAGVLMCAEVGRRCGQENLLTFDMGGTTAKLGAVDAGQAAITPTFEVDAVEYRRGSGLPLNVPAIELLEIGAGGGSIARIEMGLIAVGPESAGADPGPICYGRGGTRATITDANLCLGYLGGESLRFSGTEMRLEAAQAGLMRDVGAPLGLSAEAAAWGVHAMANANMERAMRLVSIERGRDPRLYTVVAFGGAGPLHAVHIARALGVPRVIVPVGAGVGSAVGLLGAEARVDAQASAILPVTPERMAEVAQRLDELRDRALVQAAGLGRGKARLTRGALMRYVGQGHELRVTLPEVPVSPSFAAVMRGAFVALYRQTYGYADETAPIEATEWFVEAAVPIPGNGRSRLTDPGEPRRGARRAWFPETGAVEVAVLNRAALLGDGPVAGPLLVEDHETTTVVPPGAMARLMPSHDLLIETGTGAA
jgi:N-methylhydantoinase A